MNIYPVPMQPKTGQTLSLFSLPKFDKHTASDWQRNPARTSASARAAASCHEAVAACRNFFALVFFFKEAVPKVSTCFFKVSFQPFPSNSAGWRAFACVGPFFD